MFSSAAVESTAANFVKSACTSPETPSSKLSSAAVDVTAVELRTNLPSPIVTLSLNVADPASLPRANRRPARAPPAADLPQHPRAPQSPWPHANPTTRRRANRLLPAAPGNRP